MKTRWFGISRLRPTIFVTVNLVVSAIVVALLIVPLGNVLAEREGEIENRRAILGRLQAVVAEESSIRKLVNEVENKAKQPEFLLGPNEGVISADLQAQVKRLIISNGAGLRTVRGLPSMMVDGAKLVRAEVEISGSIRSIHRSIQAIETATPYLLIIGASIRPALQAANQGNHNAFSVEPTIDAKLDIVAAIHIERARK